MCQRENKRPKPLKNKVRCLVPILLLGLSFSSSTKANNLSKEKAERFIRHLATNGDSLRDDVDPAEYIRSERLGINYVGVKNKFLISYELKSDIISEMESGNYKYRIDSLDNHFFRLNIHVPDKDLQQDYYFLNDKLASPITYYARNWKHIESQYFIFVVSDTNDCNSYSVAALDTFVTRMVGKLGFDSDAMELLKREKIYYYVCKDENEIEKLTGFKTRGIYNLAYDCVVSTYACHYHELLHLLVNYKLRDLPLYTHPFFQEGFAVAFGGRGGLDPDVVLNAGIYLEQSGMMDFSELLTKAEFMQNDASLTYPISGLYSKFLFERLGAASYMRLYRKYSGSELEVDTMRIDTTELPPFKDWMDFIHKEASRRAIDLKLPETLQQAQSAYVNEESSRLYFRVKDTLLIALRNQTAFPSSKKFSELFPSRKYHGEKYAIIATTSEVSVYNLFTGNLMASYVQSFTMPPSAVPNENGYFQFSISKKVFDEVTTEWGFHP